MTEVSVLILAISSNGKLEGISGMKKEATI